VSAKKKSPYLPQDVNDQIKDLRANKESIPSGQRVSLPNGKFANLEDLIDVEMRPGNHTAIFSDTARFLKNPSPGCMYAWVDCSKKNEAAIMGKVRSKMYRIVTADEFDETADVPIATHKMAGQDCVVVYDVVLVEIQPRAIKELYKYREAMAIRKTIRNEAFESLRSKISSQMEGRASVELEFKEIQ
jgi:hypothetical protein